MSDISAIVLAAGLGTRMKSDLPKVLHRAGGRSLLAHALGALKPLSPARTVVVTGPGMEKVGEEARAAIPEARLAIQTERKGTAHAVLAARGAAKGASGITLILYGDVPLIRTETLAEMVEAGRQGGLAVLGFEAANPKGYGRLLQDASGRLTGIREELDASPEERAIRLCNSGILASSSELLWRLLPRVGADNAKGEYYLTDLIGLAVGEGVAPRLVTCPEDDVRGVNSRAELAEIERLLQARYRMAALAGGATLIAPETVFLSADTKIGRDVVIEPNVIIGAGVEIADGATIRAFSHLEGARVAAGAIVGPFARLRPGARLEENVHVGNFVEVKNAVLERGAKANHLTYLGDARVGAGANVGAGTITCNYDGFDKHHTDIGAGAFIGSNSALVAPVKIGDGAYIGSGSVIGRDVPADALAVGRGQQEIKEGWAARLRAARQQRRKAAGKGK
ncbi:MAG: bifunctional UDP-N-acetylglucosamine diphosphorylase/glucosamine-1-phosphate N-acetyltransferase GlmU [Parvibaculaceae bacterium]